MGSCLHPRYMVNKHYDANTELGRRNLASWRVAHYPSLYPDDYQIFVPCGCCLGCRKDRARMWRVRLLHEHLYGNHDNCICLTLTINTENYVKFSDKQSITQCFRKFLDRLRYYTPCRKLPKRFFVSELGEQGDRLHFHGFMWDCHVSYADIRKCWNYGFIWIDPLKSVRQLSYATKYITKPSFNNHIPIVKVSPGLGAGYLAQDQWMDWHRSDPDNFLRYYVDFHGWKYALPHYYSRKMFSSSETNYAKYLLSKSNRPFKKFFLSKTYTDPESFVFDRDALYEVTLRTAKSRPIVNRLLNLKSLKNANFPTTGD